MFIWRFLAIFSENKVDGPFIPVNGFFARKWMKMEFKNIGAIFFHEFQFKKWFELKIEYEFWLENEFRLGKWMQILIEIYLMEYSIPANGFGARKWVNLKFKTIVNCFMNHHQV